MELEMMLLYRVDNLEEQRGIWRTWDGQWKPVFDDILPNGVSKDLPMCGSYCVRAIADGDKSSDSYSLDYFV